MILNILKYNILSDKLRIESSSVCQLKCPECPQAEGDMGIIGKGFLRFKDYKRFVDQYPGFKRIELSNYGEMLLNPELAEIIKYSYEKGITLTAENGVNLNTADDDILEVLVKYGFRSMSVSLDGASQDIYGIYRVGGDIETVFENIRKINQLKKQYGTDYPILTWQFILFGHNQHEIEAARERALSLGMRFRLKLNAHPEYSPVQKNNASDLLKAVSREEYEKDHNNVYMLPCYQFWFSPMINWDGKLLGCCLNEWSDFGNVFEKGLKECIRSEKFRYAKRMILGKEDLRGDMPCGRCAVFSKICAKTSGRKFPELVLMKEVLLNRLNKNKYR